MSSHLSIITAPGQTGGFKSAAPADKSDDGSMMGAFAALLDIATGGGDTNANGTQTPETEAAAGLGGAVDLALQAGADADAPVVFGDLIDLLAKLDQAQQAGEEIDPELLDQLNQSIEALAGAMGINLNTPPVDPTMPVAADAPVAAGTGSLLDKLAQKVGDIAGDLADLSGQLAQKLKALADGLASQNLDASDLAKLGFDSEMQTAPTDLKAAVEALIAVKPAAKETVLAQPTLDVPDTSSLSQKQATEAAEAAAPSDDSAVEARGFTPSAASDGEARDDADASADKAPAETKPDIKARAAVVAHSANDLDAQAAPDKADAAGTVVLQTTHRAELTAPAKPLATPYASVQSQLNIPGMAFEIARQAQAGTSRFEIRLDPPELGRIDVKLDVDGAGNVNAKLTVEKAETLDLLQRDQRSLEKALQQAGLDGGKTNLEFSLRQNPFARQDQQGDNSRPHFTAERGGADVEDIVQAPPVTLYRGTASAGGVNIFV